MKLPDGVNQNTACVLIALRELFDNPTWEDAYLTSNLVANNKGGGISGTGIGFNGDFQYLAHRNGLFCESGTIVARCANDDYVTFHSGGKRIRIPRQTKIVVIINTTPGSAHAECIPATLITSLVVAGATILNVAMPRKGMIVDRI